MRKQWVTLSKFLSLVLRHKPETIGLNLDEHGWIEIAALLEAAQRHKRPISREELDEVVFTNNKQRFSFSPDGLKIRANQGHSVAVDVGLQFASPPQFLFHGTVARFFDAIQAVGLSKMQLSASAFRQVEMHFRSLSLSHTNTHARALALSLVTHQFVFWKLQCFETHISYILQVMVDHNMRGMDLLHVHGAIVRTESDKMTRCSIEADASAEAVLNRLSIPDADLSVSKGVSACLACYYSFGNRGGRGKTDRQTDRRTGKQ
ncbi:MAG: RNA 2'-phosphotransferase, partial [Cyanobacteria bacterium P01_A01_bin.17]